MNIYLEGYSFGNIMAIVAKRNEVYAALMERGVDIMHITDESIVFQPGGQCLPLVEGVYRERIAELHDFDIVEISDSGILYRAFANNEGDNPDWSHPRC